MQYLIGLGSPTLAGMGLSASRVAVRGDCSAFSGLHSNAVLVNLAMSAGDGGGMNDSVPLNRPPIYSRIVGGDSAPGRGPCEFAFDDIPLPLVTRMRFSLPWNRTEVGYQPTGMNPSDLAWP